VLIQGEGPTVRRTLKQIETEKEFKDLKDKMEQVHMKLGLDKH